MDRLEETILGWLCASGGLHRLQEQCQEYSIQPPLLCARSCLQQSGVLSLLSTQPADSDLVPRIFAFTLTVDVVLLLEYNTKLGELVLHHPSHAWPLFQEVFFRVLLALQWVPQVKSLSQILLMIRLLSFPSLPGYCIQNVTDILGHSEEPRFYHLTGIVHSMSSLEKYTEVVVFSCHTEGCSDGQSTYVSVHVAGASEAATVDREFVCYTCGLQLVEDVSCRSLADKVYLIVVPLCVAKTDCESWRQQGVCVVVRRELCKAVRLGSRVSVIGVPTNRLVNQSHKTYFDVTFEANSIMEPCAESIFPPVGISDTITDLLKSCQYSPWAFLISLAFLFAADVCPCECYHRLKMAIILSLASSGSQIKDRAGNTINLLVYGSDLTTIHHLLMIGSSLAANTVHHNSRTNLTPVFRNSRLGTFVDGGSLLSADSGVCIIDNLAHKKDVKEVLQKVLETGDVGIETLKKPNIHAAANHKTVWKLNCTIWAQVDQQHRKKQYANADCDVIGELSVQDTSAISQGLANQFELVVVNDPTDQLARENLHEVMMKHTVATARGHVSSPVILPAQLQQFFENVSHLEVTLTESASELIKAFYIASRKVRVSASHGIDMPLKALHCMNAIACSHAKMNFRKEAIVEDAILAIFLYEESLASRIGYSVLGVSPCPHLKKNSDASGKQFDEQLKGIYKDIVEFCKYQGASSNHQHEE